MTEQIQERPSAWRLMIGSLLIVCAQMGLAAASELSLFSLSDTVGRQGVTPDGAGALLVCFGDRDTPSASHPELVGPLTPRARRTAISQGIVPGADVSAQYDGVVPGLTLVKLPKGVSVAEAAMKFAASPDVRYAEPNYKYKLSRTPNDPNFKDQWNLNNTGQAGGLMDADIDAPEAWDVTTGNKDLIVAVLDTGIDATHPDLKNLWSNRREATGKADNDDDNNGYVDDVSGYNFIGKNATVADDVYHGTYVAGIIGASTNTNPATGVAGVCWNVSLMICKVADKDGVNVDAAVAAVQYATAMGAKVINASWGGSEYSKSLRDAIEAAGKKGVLFVAAAGNGSVNTDSTPFYPAAYPLYNVISVMATNNRDQMARTTNYGVRTVDLAEPGEGVLSTLPSKATDAMNAAGLKPLYGVLSGTSVAAPHVSGAAALLWSKYPALSYHQIKNVLMQTSDKVVPGLCQSHGRVNVARALAAIPAGTIGRVLNTRDDPADANNYFFSIQEAIDDANDGDTLIAEGRKGSNTLFLEQIDFKGKAITLRSGDITNPSDPNLFTSSTIIFGLAKQGSLVTFANGEGRDSVIKGFTIGWGVAENGGGIRIENASPSICNCIITNNHARSFGGGIDCLGGEPLICNSVISDNVVFDATGVGGGMNFEDATPTITDCTIRNNRSMSSGGGIAMLNGSAWMANCFLANNSAVAGGGQIDLSACSPTITNCTIVVDDATPSRDGGVWAFDGSNPKIKNCILWGNGDDLFGCTATYSCIEDTEDGGEGVIHGQPAFTQGPDGVYYLSQTAAGQTVGSSCVDAGTSDIDATLATQMAGMTTRTDGVLDAGSIDVGAHYAAAPAVNYPLTVTVVDASGNPVDPNAAGGTVAPSSGTVRRFEVVTITAQPKDGYRIKRWVGTADDTKKDPTLTFVAGGPINIQVEFEAIPLFRLITRVEGQYKVDGSTDTCKIQPEHRRGQLYREGEVVAVKAVPVGPYIIDRWSGTDNDASWALTNTVTMTSDKEVTVSFTQPRTLEVPGQFPDIARAISAARTHGDTVIVKRGTYRLNGTLDFNGKAITLTSDNPDDPCCVARTVLDCQGNGRAFKFQKGEGKDSVIDGFTIQNGNGHEWGSAAPTGDVGDPGADAMGGAIACLNGSSPTLSNLIIRNCTATGFTGAPGTFAYPAQPPQTDFPEPEDPAEKAETPEAPTEPPAGSTDPNNIPGTAGEAGANGADGQPGAAGVAGGDGYKGGDGGAGYGGAFYFDANSVPTILHCTIIDCSATGGNGGAGGNGQDGQNGQNGQNGQSGQDGQDGGPGVGEGAAGAGGAGGNGGAGGAGGAGGNGGKGGDGGNGANALGGAMYFGPNCRPIIKYCTIQNTTVHQGVGAAAGAGGAGGAGGNGGTAGTAGAGGAGEPEGAAGTDGAAGTSGAGGNGGNGGRTGINGTQAWGGAIYFGEGCQIEMSDTTISDCETISRGVTTEYAGGNGGAGGAGGTDAAGGAGGNGGNGSPAGTGGGGEAPGSDGVTVTSAGVSSSFGGAILYSEGCTVKLTNCTMASNQAQDESGGAEYYFDNCTSIVTRCTFRDNSAGFDGGAQAFGTGTKITVNASSYLNNTTGDDGGGIYVWYDSDLDVNDSTFTGNEATGQASSFGGGIYGGGIFDDASRDYVNGGSIRVRKSRFEDNTAAFGAGMYWYGNQTDVSIVDSAFRTNTAEHGGGMYWSGGAPAITNCIVRGNTALGTARTVYVAAPTPDPNDQSTWPPSDQWPDPNDPNSMFDPNNAYTPPPIATLGDRDCGSGAGLYCLSSDAVIRDSFISENAVRGVGGGVYFAGGMPKLVNSLIKANTAWSGGAGVSVQWDAAPLISNCTIVENIASDPNDGSDGYGGGLLSTHNSKTIVTDSILWNNQARFGNQIAIGSKDDPIYLQRPATVSVKFSDVQGGKAGVHIEQGRTLNWLEGNIDADPLFVASYYLSQTSAGQTQTSPAVDAGSAQANQVGMAGYATRTDNRPDTGQVDMGFHYASVGRYNLTVTIVGGHGTVSPMTGLYHEFQQVTLTAIPEEGYRVRQWIGTDVDPSWNKNTAVVTMDTGADKFVSVEFELAATRNLLVPQHYRTIEDAVLAASPGATNIIISRGVYYIDNPQGIDLQSKNIRIMSTDPNDPSVVADTVIDCAGSRFIRKRAFYFHNGETSDCVISGLTIRNGYWIGAVGITGGIPSAPVDPTDQDSPIRMASGTSVTGTGYGGAILCENGSSPTFQKCVIENCTVVAAQGGNGIEGYTIGQGSEEDGYWGGHGGSGTGDSYGGAVACLGASKPTFIDCTIRNCKAKGGMGGDGGNGTQTNQGSGRESWGGNSGSATGDGHGGAVYCSGGSDAVFQNCVFANNLALIGAVGTVGVNGPGSGLADPYPNPAGPGTPGRLTVNGTIAGGAVYQENADLTFIDCRFTANSAYAAYTYDALGLSSITEEEEFRLYSPGGAIYCDVGNQLALNRCQFVENISGAVYVVGGCVVDANATEFSRNQAVEIPADATNVMQIRIVNGQIYYIYPVGYSSEGGALYIGPACSDVTFRQCEFQSNSSADSGGAIRLLSDADFIDCAFAGNKAGESGGAIDAFYNLGGSANPRTLALDIESCIFSGNSATEGFYAQGGAVHFEDVNAVVKQSYFLNNKAKSGGGLFVTGGDIKISGGSISGNTAIGGSGVNLMSDILASDYILVDSSSLSSLVDARYFNRGHFARKDPGAGLDVGGGLVLATANATIDDCMFTSNSATGAKGTGGALCFYADGGTVTHLVRNCLFACNSAFRDGGAVASNLFARPKIANSTFAENTAGNLGGAVLCDWSSKATITDSIFTKNNKYAVAEVETADATVTHSLFFQNTPSDCGFLDTVADKIIATSCEDHDATNLTGDPQFVTGPLGRFYLSQTAAGQGSNSPALNAGSSSASSVGLADLTTRTDGMKDTGVVDLGYHFQDHTTMPKYALTVEVIGGHGTVSPTSGEFYAGTAVALTANPEAGWRVARWSGTTDDVSSNVENMVIIGPDKHVTVQFGQPRTIVIGSRPEYSSIQAGVDAAKDGDVVIIPTGTYEPVSQDSIYPWTYIRIRNKNITLTGANPDNPDVVANTMLRGYRFEIADVGPETVIDGLTIGDVSWAGGNGRAGDAIQPPPHDGEYGGSVMGGTMIIVGASPTIRNCRFVDCAILGGNGGNGSNGNQQHPIGFDGGWSGWAYGGAAYIGFRSNPTFENCLFQNCRATGGNGGDGGNGYQASQGGRGGTWMMSESIEKNIRTWWDGWEWGDFDADGNLIGTVDSVSSDPRAYHDDYWKYSGYGGAVYIEYYSSPRFVDCNFNDNHTYGGVSGIGGTLDQIPDRRLNIPNFGGAVYVGSASNPEFIGCVFKNNSADTNTVSVPESVYVSFGGSVAVETDCAPLFMKCTIEDSNSAVGGGIWSSDSLLTIVDCNFVNNEAFNGGGIYAVDSTGTITDTIMHRNRALQSNIDPNLTPIDSNSPSSGVGGWGGGFCGVNSILDIRDSVFTDNRAMYSGGGVHFSGYDQDVAVEPLLHNCLIYGNTAGHDGGGLSVWRDEVSVSNSTIADNVVVNGSGDAYGGGLAVSYDANAVVVDSIIWGNFSNDKGSQIGVTHGFLYGAHPSALHLSYSDVQPTCDPCAISDTPLDLVFVFDSSATMQEYMTEIKTAATQIVDQVDKRVRDYRIAVVDFKDFNSTVGNFGTASDYPYRAVLPFSDSASRAVSAINSITTPAGSGGDAADSVYYALMRTIDGNDLGGWRGGQVNRIVMLISDAPPHDPEPGADAFRLADVVEAATLMPSKRIIAVQLGEDPTTGAYFRTLSAGAGGALVQVPDPNEAVAGVLRGIRLFTDRGPGIYVADGSALPGWNPTEQVWDSGTGNIAADPMFIAGYYLSQTASGQGRQSPAVDAGSGPADSSSIALSDRTTRTDGQPDTGTVDMGYHYKEGVTLYTLTAQVLPCDGVVHGTVTPSFALVYKGASDNVIRLEVTPDDGWKIAKWSGTDNDALTGRVNYVTLTEDRRVTITLEQRQPRVVTIPGDFPTLQGAVTAAEDGDTIVVDTGTYYSGYDEIGLLVDKAVTITSRNPDDPCTVAATVIRGPGGVNGNTIGRVGILFTGNTTRRTVLNGFTIENFGGTSINGTDGDRANGHPNGFDGGPIQGAAMILYPGASPTVKNCVIRNNAIVAGNGGNGAAADATHNAGRGGWGGWARGGAIYCAYDTCPLFVNCTIENNTATAGNGGNGGAEAANGGLANYGGNYTPPLPVDIDPEKLGAEAVDVELWSLWEWDYAMQIQQAFANQDVSLGGANAPIGGGSYVGDYRWYSAYGGGVFLDQRCKAEFVECTIRGNQTFGGLTGQGGTQVSTRRTEPLIPFEVPSYGGGVYCGADTTVTFRGCNFANNTASVPADATQASFRMDPYVGFGGGVAAENTSSVLFVDCNFVNNEADTGGALYLADSVAKVYDTRVVTNTAIRGAGVAGVGGDISVDGCEIRNNDAVIDNAATADAGVLPMGAGLFFSSATAKVQDCNIAGNSSEGSGGGIYLRGENSSTLANCLVLSNLAVRDGGGVSTNWYATPTIRNCTFIGNSSPGDPNDDTSGFGGGLFCGYFSEAKIRDSIFWKNGGRLGTELAVGTGFDLDRQCGKLTVSYSDIIMGPNDVFVDTGCTLVYGEGVIRGKPNRTGDPLFVAGPLGNFYLSPASPLVDAGSVTAGVAGMSRYTTRTDNQPDSGQVDIGYHYPIREPCKFCDLVYDGIIDFTDFARFANKWLSEGCGQAGGWCDGADFTFDTRVDALDLSFFAECWLVRDTTPPMPDASEWESYPHMELKVPVIGPGIVVEMAARQAVDAWGWDVEYYFECVHGGGKDSGWTTSRVYQDTGLSADVEYGYRVKTRDAMGNETKWSEVRFAGGVDKTAPTPDPFIQAIVADSPSQITMTARVAYDDSGVQYYFDTNTPGAHASGWLDVPVYTDVNLAATTRYAYRVKARDLSSRTNETVWSDWAYVTTQTPIERIPPTPDPMTFDPNGMPTEVNGGAGPFDYYVEMTATTATDAGGLAVQYYFECDEDQRIYPPGLSSGWQTDPTFRVPIGGKDRGFKFRVKARDANGNETAWSPWVMAVPFSRTQQ